MHSARRSEQTGALPLQQKLMSLIEEVVRPLLLAKKMPLAELAGFSLSFSLGLVSLSHSAGGAGYSAVLQGCS